MLSELTLIEEGRTRPSVEVVLRLRGVRQVHIFTHEKSFGLGSADREHPPDKPAGNSPDIHRTKYVFFFRAGSWAGGGKFKLERVLSKDSDSTCSYTPSITDQTEVITQRLS